MSAMPQPRIPPLQNGDRLTRDEFERRYDAMPNLIKAELIDGVVYMPSPVRLVQHGEQHIDLICCLGVYRAYTPGLRGGDNCTIRLDLDNEPQPDGLLMLARQLGGQACIDKDGYVAGGPESVAEIAASSVSLDLNAKFDLYRRNGVLEYIVWRVLDKEIDWFVLEKGKYKRLTPNAKGIYKSKVFPGLCLDAVALIRGDLPKVHKVLHRGLASREHADFVARLRHAAKS